MAKRKQPVVGQGFDSSPICNFILEDPLEAYLLGRLPGQQMGREDDLEVQTVEEHLLWCEVCQLRAESCEKEIKALRAALLKSTSGARRSKSARVLPAKAMGAAL